MDELRKELQDLLYEPSVMLVDRLETLKDKLSFEENLALEQLKFSLRTYELKQQQLKKDEQNGIN